MRNNDIAWLYFVRVLNAVSSRTIGKDVDELMSAGCDITRRIPSGVCITFDDGPDEELTPLILEALQRRNVRSTFFCVGRNALRYPKVVRDVRAAGHEVGNHTMSHLDLHRVSPGRLRAEIRDCQSVLQDILGVAVTSFRAPYGHFRWELRDVTRFGLEHLVGWDVAPQWRETKSRAYSDYIQRHATDGSIVLLHDHLFDVERERAREAVKAVAASLELFIPRLQQNDISFKTVSEALKGVGT